MKTRVIVAAAALAVALVAVAAFVLLRAPEPEPAGHVHDAAVPEHAAMGGTAAAGDRVMLSARELSQFGVTFGSAEERLLETVVRTAGVVTFDETRLAKVTPRFGGFVERLHVETTGERVRRGQALLAIYSPELVAAQEELLLARRLERDMQSAVVPGVPARTVDLVGAARRRLQLWDISDAQIDRILGTGEVQRTLTLHSPAGGVVIEKDVVEGQAVQAGQTLYTIGDLSEVWVEAELREADAGAVRVGSRAAVELAAFPGRTIEGRVEYVYPTLQPETRTLRARIAVPNREGLLRPGMYATVRITTAGRRALTVPTSAVVQTGERALVFVAAEAGGLEPREIRTGAVAGDLTEVLGGLTPGVRVVTSAQFLLESESNLGEVMRAMMGQMGAGDMESMEGM